MSKMKQYPIDIPTGIELSINTYEMNISAPFFCRRKNAWSLKRTLTVNAGLTFGNPAILIYLRSRTSKKSSNEC
jgi:hypothetical protein